MLGRPKLGESEKLKQILIGLPPDQIRQVDEICSEIRVSRGVVVRNALRDVIERHEKRRLSGLRGIEL